MAVTYNVSVELREFVERNPVVPGRHSVTARAALERQTIHIPDIVADPEYTYQAWQAQPYSSRPWLCRCCARRRLASGVITLSRIGGTALYRQADRAGRQPSPIRPLLPLRTPVCCRNYRPQPRSKRGAWSSRPRRARSCALSPARRLISSRC